MFRWLNKDDGRKKETKAFASVTEGLQRLYRDKLLPLEKDHVYHQFYQPELTDAEFAGKPMVLLLGQYSTGKSTFIRHLLGRDYPGLRIGPEPTTDKFVAVCHGENDQVIPGNALVVDPSMPFTQLSHFGNNFLTRFEASRCNCPVLEGVTLIDSPGVLSGEKQRTNRGYEFEAVVKWFAERVDMILVLFDAWKLDISDEFRRVLVALKGNDQKIHIVLNKADRVNTSQLMRVYGALMWSLGKVIETPEVSRVYIGSFWDEPLSCDEQRKLFESEENDLYTHIARLPSGAAVRKLNDLIKRARLAKVHAYILETLNKKMPSMFGKSDAQKKMIAGLTEIYREIAKEKNLALGDFPDPRLMQEKLAQQDFGKFKKVDPKKLAALESMLTIDIPMLLEIIPAETATQQDATLTQVGSAASPFAVMKVGGATENTVYLSGWLVSPDPEDYTAEFEELDVKKQGKITGAQAKQVMTRSKLPSNVLHKIWNLSDIDKDGALNLYEFALSMHFIKMRLDGQDLPAALPPNMAAPMKMSAAPSNTTD